MVIIQVGELGKETVSSEDFIKVVLPLENFRILSNDAQPFPGRRDWKRPGSQRKESRNFRIEILFSLSSDFPLFVAEYDGFTRKFPQISAATCLRNHRPDCALSILYGNKWSSTFAKIEHFDNLVKLTDEEMRHAIGIAE